MTVQVYCSYNDAPKLRLVRFAQILCGFDKVYLEKGQTRTQTVAVGLSTLARYDTRATSVDLVGKTVPGAYVVDEGNWAGKYTRNPPLLVKSGSILTDCLQCGLQWQSGTAVAQG